MMMTCLMGVAVLILSADASASAAGTAAANPKADSRVADPAVTIFVRQFPVVCNSIASSKINRRERGYRLDVTRNFRHLEYFVTVGQCAPQGGAGNAETFTNGDSP